MKNSEELRQQLRSINRKSYPAYKGLKGLYHFGNYILSIDHVQGDPFASPSHVSIQISHRDTGFPVEYYKDTLTGTTLCDYLTRQFEKQVSQYRIICCVVSARKLHDLILKQKAPAKAACSLPVIVVRRFFPGQPVK